jgi:hypothetical protein
VRYSRKLASLAAPNPRGADAPRSISYSSGNVDVEYSASRGAARPASRR